MESALKTLRKQFLPVAFDPTGNYSPEVLAQARAYRVLAHAEVEHFLEDRADEVKDAALDGWKRSRKANVTLLCLMAFSGLECKTPPDVLEHPEVQKRKRNDERLQIDKRIVNAANSFYRVVQNNHGVKERNVLSLLITVGVNHGDIDPLWLIEMNSLGSKRGEAAHTSARQKTVQHPPDPKLEYDSVQRVVFGLADIDNKLTALKR
jgi:hypothetical protein